MVSFAPLDLVLRTQAEEDEPWVINQKIFDILSAYLQSDATLSPADAAQEIDKLFPLNRAIEGSDKENEKPASFLWEMWGLAISIADQIPWDHPAQEKLIKFIQALRDLPGTTIVQMDGWGEVKIWSDLPILGPVMTEISYAIDLEGPPDAQEAIRGRQQNFEAFAARLTECGIVDRSLYGLHALRDALEQEPDRRAKAYHTQGPQLDLYVPLAAEWMLLAGRILFRLSRTTRGFTPPYSAGGKNWKGADGFSVERWNFWKERFGEIKVHDQVKEKTREISAKAEDAMKKIEAHEA